ncbi:hypothetical protein SELMODRAFT_406690 [Selaginella moellendorffii]|uniref:Uncharacterized protein n=1 Tax=Selaginella moellendorffii TaxID=88036 RepID=D8R153_SELML|nr:hypothetical protein SELMODRAFT_406690 [Selaginella moellendorffii]
MSKESHARPRDVDKLASYGLEPSEITLSILIDMYTRPYNTIKRKKWKLIYNTLPKVWWWRSRPCVTSSRTWPCFQRRAFYMMLIKAPQARDFNRIPRIFYEIFANGCLISDKAWFSVLECVKKIKPTLYLPLLLLLAKDDGRYDDEFDDIARPQSFCSGRSKHQ